MGSYVNLTLGDGPDEMVFGLKEEASSAMWKTVQAMGDEPPERALDLWDSAMDSYWQGVWWMDRAILVEKESARASSWGRSASSFEEAVLRAEAVSRICASKKMNCSSSGQPTG
jgi:hypothetical protein